MDTAVDTEDWTIAPLTSDTWDTFADLVERHNGIFGGCWCTWYHTMHEEKTFDAADNRALKQRLVAEGRAHAALVMQDGEAIGWAEYGTCAELPNMKHRKELDATTTVRPDYRITCLFVDRRFRRHGVATAAVRGALDLIAASGGGRVEAYPRDADDAGKKLSASFLSSGTRAMFSKLGFSYDRPKGTKNCVMVCQIEPA